MDADACVAVLWHVMQWRFADLPVRTKFMVTLGIPVLGMVLLIGKQVDGSLKRRRVMQYINTQADMIGLYSNVAHEVQKESAFSVGFLTGQPVTTLKLDVQYKRTDEVINALVDPALPLRPLAGERSAFDGLGIMRERVQERWITALQAARSYRGMAHTVLDELGRSGRLALDPETKDRMYAHLRLLNAKEALSEMRDLISIGYADHHLSREEMSELAGQVSNYETNIALFERDAPPEVLAEYRALYQGPDVNFMRSLIGSVKEHGEVDVLRIAPREWWELSLRSLDKLKAVEDHSLALIVKATAENSRDAEMRLLIVLIALFGVVGAVSIMGFMILRGVRNTVSEVSEAARSLAVGDVNATVPVGGNDEIGQMARSFNEMTTNIRSLASSAEAIGKGNYDTPVNVRGPQDVLGIALARMKENLKAARLRDDEQTGALQAEKVKLEQANQRIHVLIKEMHHRVKNNLQVVASLLRLQSGTFSEQRLQDAFEQSQNRVNAMALIHEKLYKGDELSTVDVAQYIHELFAELVRLNDVSDRITYETDIDAGLSFDLNTMVPLGLLLNELITNALKHAFEGRPEGNIRLELHRVEGNELDLVFTDDGVGMPLEKLQPDGTTLGSTLIESLVDQLNGRMTVDADKTGTSYHIRFRSRT
jgi:two-component sensor histidine kinase/HAMP domain-containing protein